MIHLDGSSLSIDALLAIADDFERVDLSLEAARMVDASRRVVDAKAAGSEPAYGVNTGFGSFAEVRIAPDALKELQLNLLRSHAAGVGEPLPVRTVRACMALRANVLAKGYSGIRRETLERLVDLLNARVHPHVPCRGSVGASGDLAPLAHLALVLVGEGQVCDGDRVIPGHAALKRAGLSPIALEAKEGLALINGTQPSTAVLALALAGAERLARTADIVAAMSIDALLGSMQPFAAPIHAARPFPGQMMSAANIAMLMAGSPINKSHEHCGRVQDAYSERCAAQVHGAARESMAFVRRVVEIEANAATDNPMVFLAPDGTGDIVSGGNFHGAPVATAADLLAIALAQLATVSERRTERLVNPSLSNGLPAFLTREGGVRCGLMLAQVTAAALASELKILAHPASVDTIPTSGNKEDHVSMSMTAALKAQQSLTLATEVLAIELLSAAQAIDLRAPLRSSDVLMRVHARVREEVSTLTIDRPPAPDIDAITNLISSGGIENACPAGVK